MLSLSLPARLLDTSSTRPAPADFPSGEIEPSGDKIPSSGGNVVSPDPSGEIVDSTPLPPTLPMGEVPLHAPSALAACPPEESSALKRCPSGGNIDSPGPSGVIVDSTQLPPTLAAPSALAERPSEDMPEFDPDGSNPKP